MDLRNQKFGIEIEMTGIKRKEAAEIINKYFKSKGNGESEIKYEGGYYDKYLVKEEENKYWQIVKDGSIVPKKSRGENNRGLDYYKVELVSPICSYKDIETVQDIVRELRENGALINKSCGIHVHIDATNHTPNSLKNISNIINAKEDLIYKALNVSEERKRNFCKIVDEIYLERLNKFKPKTMEELKNIWYYRREYNHENITGRYHSSRYHALNLHSVFQKGTVEFRYFNSTLHAGKVKAYIQLCLAISAKAINQKRASPQKINTQNDKYSFRVWLLSLGLIGDEFKTARKHLLSNLDGNSAWLTEEQAVAQRERLRQERVESEESTQEITELENQENIRLTM